MRWDNPGQGSGSTGEDTEEKPTLVKVADLLLRCREEPRGAHAVHLQVRPEGHRVHGGIDAARQGEVEWIGKVRNSSGKGKGTEGHTHAQGLVAQRSNISPEHGLVGEGLVSARHVGARQPS